MNTVIYLFLGATFVVSSVGIFAELYDMWGNDEW